MKSENAKIFKGFKNFLITEKTFNLLLEISRKEDNILDDAAKNAFEFYLEHLNFLRSEEYLEVITHPEYIKNEENK